MTHKRSSTLESLLQMEETWHRPEAIVEKSEELGRPISVGGASLRNMERLGLVKSRKFRCRLLWRLAEPLHRSEQQYINYLGRDWRYDEY